MPDGLCLVQLTIKSSYQRSFETISLEVTITDLVYIGNDLVYSEHILYINVFLFITN